MLHDSSTIANWQEQSCYKHANSIFANDLPMETDRELIQALIEHTGLPASQIARRAKMAVTTLTRPLNMEVGHELSKATINKLRAAFPDFPGFTGETRESVEEPAPSAYLPVEVLPSFAGMGGGGTGEGEVAHALISRTLIEDELRAKPSDLILIEARGESMLPDFHHGDQILIDKRDRDPVQPGAFALWDGDGYVVKLVERVPHKRGFYRIFSANSRFREYEVGEDQIRIMGRPVWFGRRL